MMLRANLHNIYADMSSKYTEKFAVFALILCTIMCSRAKAEFVPFVIPAKPNPESPIAVTSFEPIKTDSDRLVAAGGHFYRGEKQVRLWGVNLSFGANLPTHEDAPYIAARLAAAGVNTVRCHHLDTSRWPRGLWNSRDGKTIEPEALDRLDFFINQLALHGICVNLNLHVGRAHSEYLGLPGTNGQYDKIFGIFTAELIDAQKDFARTMLSHVNRYRGISYADDPSVAIVEITNEDSFFMWSGDETLRSLPAYYADILQKKFNAWLKEKYGSDAKLRDAWSGGAQPLGRNMLTDIILTDGKISGDWQLEQHSDCKALLRQQNYLSKDALRIDIDKFNETEWHLQFKQGGFKVEAGQYYTVTFEAAGEKTRKLSCGVSQAHEPWQNLGLSRSVELTQKWQTFHFGFVARDDDDNARLSFSFGSSDVPFYLANIKLQPGGRVGLRTDESISNNSVPVYAESETPQRATDRMIFLTETEKAYFDGMRSFIKSDLGCKALVTGTIVFGPLGLYAQSDMDFIDAHAYWQHPRFPGRPWDAGNWLVDQKPMTDFPAEATLFRLATERLAGKPFTVTEYNHPAPLDSQAACVPMMASFAAAQDWDGIWFYTYSHGTDDWYREYLYSYFDIDANPAKWGFMRAGAAIFRDKGLGNAGKFKLISLIEPAEYLLTSLARLHLKYESNLAAILRDRAEVNWRDMLDMGVCLTFENSAEDEGIKQRDGAGELEWSVKEGRGLYVAKGDACVLAGHTSRFGEITSDIRISEPSYAVITFTALDGMSISSSKKILITACGRCENTGMIFSDDRRTVGRNWGGPPVRIETVTGTITMPPGQWKCEAIGPDGMPKHEVPVNDGTARISPEYGTMWYLLTR